MGMFERLFGRRPDPPRRAAPTESPKQSLGDPLSAERASFHTKRPFDTITDALQRWNDSDSARAEELFKLGLDEYRRVEPAGLDFALGRYGAFLLEQDRVGEAATVLEEALARNTDIPAIWSDYLRIAADRRDFGMFTSAAGRMATCVKYNVEAEFFLSYARRADREGASEFAVGLADWTASRAAAESDQNGRWSAIGDLGRILERAGRLDEAMKAWRAAFEAGSSDGETVNRLSMQLERAKDHLGAVAVAREGLKRDLPANVQETLRKRIVRCEDRIGGKRQTASRQRADVAAFSVRHGADAMRALFQIRPKPPVKDLELVGNRARCLLVSKEASTIVDIELATGTEVHRVENLPLLGDTWFAPDRRGIAIRRTAAIGKGPTLLRFLNADGQVASESAVPDATSEIALGPDLWYVGCRNGLLYAFGLDGKQRWSWETPGSRSYDGEGYFRPCPYYVASQQSFAVVASMGNIYAVGPNGQSLWHAELPNERQTRWSFTIPLEGDEGNRDAYRILGLSRNASSQDARSAYRRLALATHPDRNPDDSEAAARFRQVQGAYERVLAGAPVAGSPGAGLTVTMEIQGIGPMASFVSANAGGVVVGSSQGRLYHYEGSGTLREARILGEGPVRAALRADGTVGAAWCSDALLFLKDGRIVNATSAIDWPRALTMLGDDVVLWRGNDVQVMDSNGRMLWAVEFSKTVTSVATAGDTVVCAAGVLAAFRREGAPNHRRGV
jgi:tetratricopeptide (TPR) repeat protein